MFHDLTDKLARALEKWGRVVKRFYTFSCTDDEAYNA